MNRGVVHNSPVQQMMAAGNPNWWAHNNNNKNNNLNSFVPPHSSSPFLFASPITPESWSHLSGLVGEEERSTALMNTHQPAMDQFVKQDPSSPSHHGFVSHLNNEDFSKSNHNNNNNKNNSSWSPHHHNNSKFITASNSTTSATATTTTAAASSPQSCVTNNLFEFSSTTTAAKSDHLLKPDQCNSPAVKKAKVQTSASTFKVRKFGDRITTLHQLVSPFGKTDTASVLLEAIGYVRFLQSQIEALSLPYLSSGQGNNKKQQPRSVQGERKCIFPEDPGQLLNDKCLKRKGVPDPEEPKDLRSRGLCLVPVSSTLNVGRDYGADYWAPTLGDFQ